MNKVNYLWLFQLLAFFGFAQEKPLSSYVKSQLVNEQGNAQFVQFDESLNLKMQNRSNLLIDFFKPSENTSFVKIASNADQLGFLHETFQQYFDELPVEFGIYKTHLKNGVLSSMGGEYIAIQDVNTSPSISEERAFSLALNFVKEEQQLVAISNAEKTPKLVVFPILKDINSKNRLAFKINIYSETPLYNADIYVDAHTGEIIFKNNKIHQNNVGANGTTLYNGVKRIRAEQFAGGYRLRQTAFGNGIQTFDATNGIQNATDIISSTNNFTTNGAAVQVHWGAERTYQYYLQKHNRNSFDGNGALIKSYITPVTADANAVWTGSALYYSMGNGTNMGPVTSLDVVGHEFTHGVIDYSANLIYAYQAGAINEAFADIFGEMVENYAQGTNDWLCGAAFIPTGIRSLSNPKSKNDPDTYLGQYWHTGSDDNYGVHTNSGVINKWFYLLAEGGTGTNDYSYSYNVNGIGIQKAARIAYRALTEYLTPTSNFLQARYSFINAANDLYGYSPEYFATIDALKAVGMYLEQTDNTPPTTPLNLVISSATPYSVSLSWDASTDNISVLGYSILMNGSVIKTSSTTNTTVFGTLFYLEPNTNYEFTVIAFDASGNISQYSNIETVLFDTIAPTAPINLTSSGTTQTSTVLTWNPSTDNFGVVGYKIFQNYQGNITEIPVVSPPYTVENLFPSENYSFKVKAIDSSGNESNFSNTENVTTLAPCASGIITLTINFDWYPEETSWDIRDDNNVVVASGGNYPISWNPPPPAVYPIVLPSGYYTLNMHDTFGDGIWSQTPGVEGYILQSNVIIAFGSENNPSANTVTTPFCIDTSLNRTASIPEKFENDNTKIFGTVYPNPVEDKLHFKNAENERLPFVVVDITGKVILKGELDSKNPIDVSSFQSGMYVLEIIGKEEKAYYKFIKK